MPALPSAMIPLGSPLPEASLIDVVTGEAVQLGPDTPGVTLVAFLCNHCPYVVHILPRFTALARVWSAQGVRVVAINSNDVDRYPQDGPAAMAELAVTEGWTWPFCLDASQEVARQFSAACTPDFFLFDGEARLAYRGEFCPSRPGSAQAVTGSALASAVDALLQGERPGLAQRPSLGCSIKWRSAP